MSSFCACVQVGVSQQWYDELDNLAFSEPESELSAEEESTSDENLRERGVCIDCAINTSPGRSEVLLKCICICCPLVI